MAKPNCNKCVHRASIPGDEHSECKHPKASVFSWIYVMSLPELPDDLVIPPLNIKCNTHAIKKGWFNWPLNFDPNWLYSCDGFTENEKKESE